MQSDLKSPSLSQRQRIADDTIVRSASMTREHAYEGATSDSVFIHGQLPALNSSANPEPNTQLFEIVITNSDSFTAARNIMKAEPETKGKVAVLNLASDEQPAGGWLDSLSKTQEEALCYSSTLYSTLDESYYPWPNLGPGSIAGVFSPGVVIFKDDLDHGCVDLQPEACHVVSVITVAAPRGPELTGDELAFKNISDLQDLRGKIRLVYRMAAHNGQRYLILGAMGCGAYRCPPRLVAEEMKSILVDAEFRGWFRNVTFAIYSKKENGEGNFAVFKSILAGVKMV